MKATCELLTHEDLVRFYSPPNFMPSVGCSGGFRYVYTADTCHKCRAQVNVPQNHCWICQCGAYNAMCWNHSCFPWVAPRYGPTRFAIQMATTEVINIFEEKP